MIVIMALRKVKAVLIDLSGTLHIESSPIAGAVEALKRLREKNIIVRFVTNTTKESKRILYEKLLSMGFQLQQNEIFTSLVAARQYVDSKQVRPLLLLENEALEDFQGVHTHNPNAVVIGLAPNRFDYVTMNEAFRLLLEGASFIAVHKSRYYQCKDGLSLGPGPFVTALEYATDLKAVVVGKPEPRFFLSAIDGLGCQPDETLMIGDDVRDDIGGAQAIGMVGILVKTGKYRNGDEHKLNSPPNLVHENFPDAVNFILNNMV